MSDTSDNPTPPRRVSTTTQRPPARPPREAARTPQDRTEPMRPQEPPTPRKQAILELIGLACMPLAGYAAVDTIRHEEGYISPFALDVAAIEHHSSDIADGVVMLAASNPVLAATLDRIGTLTPFASLLGAGIALGMQIAENHGKLPETFHGNPAVPIVPRDELAQMLRERGEAMAAANGNGA